MVNMWYRDPDTKELVQIPILTVENTDEYYVKKTGDTMEGPLGLAADSAVLSSTVAGTLGIYTKAMDALAPLYVGDPTSYDQAATKGYVDKTWQTWTPVLTGMTGTVTKARYIQIGKFVSFAIEITVSTIAGSTNLFSLPVPMAHGAERMPLSGFGSDTGVGTYVLPGWYDFATNTVRIMTTKSAANDFRLVDISPTGPFTWAAGDVIRFNGSYEAS